MPTRERRPRRFRLTGPLADQRWRIGVVAVLTRDLGQRREELTLEYLARRRPESPEDIWHDPEEPMVELSVIGQVYVTVTTVFSHGSDTLQVQGAWRFHLPADDLHGQILELRLVDTDDETGRSSRSLPIELTLLD